MRLTRIEHAPNDVVRLFVDHEAEPCLEAPLEAYLESGLRPDEPVSDAELQALRSRAEEVQAREAALSLLAHRPRSTAELERRLRKKEHPDRAIEVVVAWLTERGYLDDHAFAEAFVRDRLRLRPRGRFGLLQELRARGVAPETAETALALVFRSEGVDENDLARSAAEGWARRNRSAVRAYRAGDREAGLRTRQRLYSHLARRGFSGDAVRRAMDVVLGDVADPGDPVHD